MGKHEKPAGTVKPKPLAPKPVPVTPKHGGKQTD